MINELDLTQMVVALGSNNDVDKATDAMMNECTAEMFGEDEHYSRCREDGESCYDCMHDRIEKYVKEGK